MQPTKTVNGKQLTADRFAYVGDPNDIGTWHLALDTAEEAHAALGYFDRTQGIPAEKKSAVARKIVAACKKFGIDASGFAKRHGIEMTDGGLDGRWMEVFRAGDYGGKGSYTPADLDEMVANYDPAKHEAPLVIGHPEHDAPAWGWVESLKRIGNVLMAKPRQVSRQFEDLVQSGAFKKRSISFYRNPLSLRHVGFLGAMPPEVKGLADVTFREGQFDTFDFNEEEEMEFSEMKKSLVEALKEFFGGDKPKNFSDADAQKLVEAATKPLQDKLKQMETQFAETEKKASATAAAAAAANTVSLAEKAIAALKDAKKWIPAFDKMGVAQIFAELAKSDVKVEFGEGDKKTQKPVFEVFSDFLKALPELVPTREIVMAAASARKGGKLVQFNEPDDAHTAIDGESIELAEAAQALCDKDSKLSFGEALKRARAERAQAAAGAV